MALITLGSRGPVTGAVDTRNVNPGNWTIVFPPSMINVNVPQFQVYKMVVASNAPSSPTFNVYVDTKLWDVGIYGTLNSWDPSQPLVMRPGETLYFDYSDPVSDGAPPTATVWIRYDSEILRLSV
jgi:hypothetical protein